MIDSEQYIFANVFRQFVNEIVYGGGERQRGVTGSWHAMTVAGPEIGTRRRSRKVHERYLARRRRRYETVVPIRRAIRNGKC